MWFTGACGVVMVVLVSGAQQLFQLMQQDNDVDANDPVFECFARLLRTPQKHGVLLLHLNHPDVDRYVASVRSSPLIFRNLRRVRPWSMVSHPNEQPYGLLVLLMTTPRPPQVYGVLLNNWPQYRRGTRVLVVLTAAGVPGARLQPILAMAARASVWNVVVLVADGPVYTYFPYGSGACGERRTPEALGLCQRLPNLDQLFPAKAPRQFNGCPVSLSVAAPPPAVLDAASMSVQPLVAGFELALANIVSGRLNMSTTRSTGWECLPANVYYTDALRWYVPVAGPRAQWQGPVLLFQAPLWLAILVGFLLNTLVWWLAGVGGFMQCLLGSLVTLLNGAESLPRRTHRRFLVTAWTLCSLVLVAAYQSQLLSTLLTPVLEPQPITTEGQLLASDTPIVITGSRFMDVMLDWMAYGKHIDRTHGSPKPPAVLQTELMARYRAREQADARGRPTLVAFPNVAVYVPLCVQFDYHIATLPAVCRLVRRLIEAGLLAKFMRALDFSRWTVDGGEDEPLSLGHMGFAFLVLLMGCALATVGFVLEVVGWRLQHEWWPVFCTGARRCATRVHVYWRRRRTRARR